MINKIEFKDEPDLFVDIDEFFVDTYDDHRRGSNFFRYGIVEFKDEHSKYFSEVKNFDKYLGTWKTDTVIWDDDYGYDTGFSELTRVEKVEKISYEWKEV